MDYIAKRSSIPIFADESVKTFSDAKQVIESTNIQGINIKMMKSGIADSFRIIDLAKAAKKDLMLGCMLETRRGISFSLALACGTGAFKYLDLDSHLLLNEKGPNSYFKEFGPNMGF